MISVPNHRRRLSGSKWHCIGLLLSVLFSCTAPRTVAKKPPGTPTPEDKENKVRVYDPKTDSYILVPRDAIKVDTIRWTEDSTPPIITDDIIRKGEPVRKDHYDIALLMPFNAPEAEIFADHRDPRLFRFMQYYAGILMAVHDIDSMHLPVTIRSYDAEATMTSVDQILNKPEVRNAEVIVGPYEMNKIEAAAAFALKQEIMIVSPWIPAFASETENPFLVHVFPGLNTHAEAIVAYIAQHMADKKVFVVGRNTPGDLQRMQMFTQHPHLRTHELVISDTSPDLSQTDIHSLMEDMKGTVFILPYFTKQDETFVNSFMRKVHADKGTREAIVFGLPQWLGYAHLNANYMESLSVHLSISSFIDIAHPYYQKFRNRFFQKFHTIPDLQAFQGYDLLMWLATTLSKYGEEGLIGDRNPYAYGLSSGFDIQPVFKKDSPSTGEMNVPLYYENKRIRIVRYVDQDFILVK